MAAAPTSLSHTSSLTVHRTSTHTRRHRSKSESLRRQKASRVVRYARCPALPHCPPLCLPSLSARPPRAPAASTRPTFPRGIVPPTRQWNSCDDTRVHHTGSHPPRSQQTTRARQRTGVQSLDAIAALTRRGEGGIGHSDITRCSTVPAARSRRTREWERVVRAIWREMVCASSCTGWMGVMRLLAMWPSGGVYDLSSQCGHAGPLLTLCRPRSDSSPSPPEAVRVLRVQAAGSVDRGGSDTRSEARTPGERRWA